MEKHNNLNRLKANYKKPLALFTALAMTVSGVPFLPTGGLSVQANSLDYQSTTRQSSETEAQTGIMPTAATPSAIVPIPGTDITTTVDWVYRAFGQSTDLRFHNSASIPEQDGINNVWINPTWFDDPILRDDTPVLGMTSQNVSNDPDAMLGKPGAHLSLFTKSSLFIPSLDGALKPDVPVKLQIGDEIVLESRGGKITTGHDGMTFFYTELPTDKLYRLTADITKSSIGSHPAAGSNAISSQTGAGILARDFVPGNRKDPYQDGYEEVPAPSNFIGAGIWQNNNTSRPGFAIRTGVISPFHGIGSSTNRGKAGGDSTTNPNSNSAIGLTFRYSLEHRNDGFYYWVSELDGTVVVPETKITDNGASVDMLMSIDEDSAYWGFAASREIRILVENVLLEEMGNATFKHEAPDLYANAPDADIVMRSAEQTSLASFDLGLRPNYDGSLTVKKDNASGEVVYQGSVTEYNEQWITVSLSDGSNTFYYDFTTTDSRPDTKSAQGTVIVTKNPATARTALEYIWVSPDGAGNLSGVDEANAAPVSLLAQAGALEAGQTVYLVDAKYGKIEIKGNSGNKGDATDVYDGNRITIMPEPGVYQVRADNVTLANNSIYIHIKGIYAGGTSADDRFNGSPFVLGATDYILTENCTAVWSTATGFTQNSAQGEPNGTWTKYNTYLNCEAIHNEDVDLQNADGFAMQGFGFGNRYINCVASYAGDDGWDHFLRVSDGSGGSLYFENCIAYSNNANGFKLGGEGQPTPVTLVNCLSYDNGMAGYSDNFNPGEVELYNCIAIDNGTQNFIMRDNPVVEAAQLVQESVSFRSVEPTNFFVDAVAGSVVDSALITDVWNESYWNNKLVTANDFASLDRSKAYSFDSEGNLVRGDFGRFLPWEEEEEENTSRPGSSGSSKPSGGGSGGGSSSPSSSPSSSAQEGGTWTKDANGWFYKNPNNTYPASSWQQLGGEWYMFDATGHAMTGWIQTADGTWYFADKQNADMQTGWIFDEEYGSWYYLQDTGAMQTGWVFDPSYGSWYYTDMSGAMSTGWVFDPVFSGWYYLNESGAMLANGMTPDGYLVDATGRWIQ